MSKTLGKVMKSNEKSLHEVSWEKCKKSKKLLEKYKKSKFEKSVKRQWVTVRSPKRSNLYKHEK